MKIHSSIQVAIVSWIQVAEAMNRSCWINQIILRRIYRGKKSGKYTKISRTIIFRIGMVPTVTIKLFGYEEGKRQSWRVDSITVDDVVRKHIYSYINQPGLYEAWVPFEPKRCWLRNESLGCPAFRQGGDE